MIWRTSFDRFQPPGPRDEKFQDVPEVCCSYCATYFEQQELDETVCPECKRVCKMCSKRFNAAWGENICDRCSQFPDEPEQQEPNNPV